MSSQDRSRRPNILLVMTDQLRYPPSYESEELQQFRRKQFTGEESLRTSGVSFRRHYTMSAACAPSRASFLTGHYPSLHGVTQTDGLAKSADSADMFWLAPDTVPTLGDWFRAGGYRTFYKGKWHVSHPHLDDPDGEGYLLSIEDDGTQIPENIAAYLEADLLDEWGFSEWVGPDPHGLGKHNTATVKDAFTADETVALLERLDKEESDQPWLTVCSFLNPHDIALFGLIALTQGLRYDTGDIPEVANAPTHDEDLSTKPACQQSYVDAWGKMLAPQPWIETHRKFYYQLQGTVDAELAKVLDALRATKAVREHDRGLPLRPRRHARRSWRHAPEMAQRLRGDNARAIPRLQPSDRRRPARDRRADEPRRPASHPAWFRGDRPGRGVEARLGRPHGGAAARGARPVRLDLSAANRIRPRIRSCMSPTMRSARAAPSRAAPSSALR